MGSASNERRTTSRSDSVRSDRDASTVANRSTTAHESASTHSGAVVHSATSVGHSANVAAADMAHPASASVAALGEGGIRDEGRNRQNCETCD